MTDQTNDPVAAAAALLAQQQQPKGIVGELLDDVRELGEKIDSFIHPQDGENAEGNAAGTVPASVGSEENSGAATATPGASASGVGEDPNAGASAAASHCDADSASSAQAASQSVDTGARSVSASLVERARVSIDHLRAHLWTFEQSTVAHLHKELDFVESLFK
jgi:hypothetical protein